MRTTPRADLGNPYTARIYSSAVNTQPGDDPTGFLFNEDNLNSAYTTLNNIAADIRDGLFSPGNPEKIRALMLNHAQFMYKKYGTGKKNRKNK